MTQATQPTLTQTSSSATNFDLPSLHILQHEIDVALKNAETHLSEFNDDEEQAPLLLDSVDVMEQLARILDLLSLDGGSDLTDAIAKSLQLLYDRGDNSEEDIILDISEAIMTLDRYVEFVLLKETLEPPLLVPIINKLHAHIGEPALEADSFDNRKTGSISISNPEQNFQSLAELNLDSKTLSSAYRAGLGVVLASKHRNISADDRKKLQAMQSACEFISARSDTLFWQAATAAVTDIESALPLRNPDKRTLVFLEQQFHNYLSINDKRFADLVSFACHRNNVLAKHVKRAYANNRLDDNQHEDMKRFLFGPNRSVTDTLNDIIQEQISKIKDDVDTLARGDSTPDNPVSIDKIVDELRTLGSSLRLLDLDEASVAMIKEAEAVSQWQSPTPENFDELLAALIVAENASIHMAKLHTPGAVNLPLHNGRISLHQLDTSYDIIVAESRKNIAKIEQAITDYIQDENHANHWLTTIPELLREITGSLGFLYLKDAMQMINRLASYIEDKMITGEYNEEQLKKVADVIMAVDYHLEGFENNHPVGKQAMNVGHHSLNELLAA